jgi:hypothetical protein
MPNCCSAAEVRNLAPSHRDILKFYSRTVLYHSWKQAEGKRHSCDNNRNVCGCHSVEQWITAALYHCLSYSSPTLVKCWMFKKTLPILPLTEGCTNSKHRAARATKFYIEVSNIMGFLCVIFFINCIKQQNYSLSLMNMGLYSGSLRRVHP